MHTFVLLALSTLNPACCDCPDKFCCCDPCHCYGAVPYPKPGATRCGATCECNFGFVWHDGEKVKPPTDAPKATELKAAQGCTFTATPRGGILTRPDGSIEVVFDYGRPVEQRDIDEWFAKQGQRATYQYTPQAYYGSPFSRSQGSACGPGGCGQQSSGRAGLFRRR